MPHMAKSFWKTRLNKQLRHNENRVKFFCQIWQKCIPTIFCSPELFLPITLHFAACVNFYFCFDSLQLVNVFCPNAFRLFIVFIFLRTYFHELVNCIVIIFLGLSRSMSIFAFLLAIRNRLVFFGRSRWFLFWGWSEVDFLFWLFEVDSFFLVVSIPYILSGWFRVDL